MTDGDRERQRKTERDRYRQSKRVIGETLYEKKKLYTGINVQNYRLA